MADSQYSALSAASAPDGTELWGIDQGATDKKLTLAVTKTFVNTAPVFAAGSAAAASWPTFTSGTLLTTPEVGAVELDANCFYATTDAGNRGVVRTRHFIRLAATRTFTSNTSQQAIFASPAGGTLTLETGVYVFECLIYMNTMSATTGNGKFSIIGAGGATLASILWHAVGSDLNVEGTGATRSGSAHIIATQTAADIVTAATQTSLVVAINGTFEVTVAGTIIPSFAQTTAAAAVAQIGTYFSCERIGGTGVVSVGQWT